MSHTVFTSRGEALRLGQQLGRGGEGTVYAIVGNALLAAKIFKPEIRESRQAKISTMVTERWHEQAREVAFPVDTLWSHNRRFIGFTMQQWSGRRPIHEAYNPSTRRQHFPRASFPFLVRIARNAATAVAKVHNTGCVVGDLNHSGFLVAADATVSLIDADSFQVRSKGQLFPCRVGVPEYTPPELQGVNLGAVLRTINHDAFGLACLIFYTLFLGRHPFAGRPIKPGDVLEQSEAIKQYQFAYSSESAHRRLQPPLHAPTLKDIPRALADLFERAFGHFGVSRGRPSALEWVRALTTAETQLVQCPKQTSHQYFREAQDCPWCRMEKALPGFQAFGSQHAHLAPGSQIDIGQYIAALTAVPDLGPVPDIMTLLPRVKATVSAQARQAARTSLKYKSIALTAAVLSVATVLALLTYAELSLFTLALSGALLTTAGLVGFLLFRRKPPEVKALGAVFETARQDWESQKSKFHQQASEEPLNKARADALRSIQHLELLPRLEAQKLKQLTDNREEAQRTRYLEKFLIETAPVQGLGKTRRDRLVKNGIVTAADLARTTRARLLRIKGCKAVADNLLAWKAELEKKFNYRPALGVSPADLMQVKNELLSRRSATEKKVLQQIADVETIHRDIMMARSNPSADLQRAYAAIVQAECDEQYLRKWRIL